MDGVVNTRVSCSTKKVSINGAGVWQAMRGVYFFFSFRRLDGSFDSLMIVRFLSLIVEKSCRQFRSPPIDGFASLKSMFGALCPSTKLRAAVSASSLCVTPVWDFTLPIYVLCPWASLVYIILSTSWMGCL